MEKKDIEAQLQYNGYYVEDFSLKIIDKNSSKDSVLDVNLKLGISEIKIDKDDKYSNLKITYDISIKDKDKEYLKIKLSLIGMFRVNKDLSDDMFEKMIKINGTPMLSQSARAYINATTSLSGIPPVNLPLFDFRKLM